MTALLAAVFVVCGVALVGTTYLLMEHATRGFVFGDGHRAVAVVTRHTAGGPVVTNGRPPSTSPAADPAQAARLAAEAAHQHAVTLHQLLLQSALALAAISVLAVALAWLVAGRVLRPIRTITGAVREISATNLHSRLALAGPDDELKELGDTFDALVGRLEAAFAAQRRFVANASHELRTPLARQRTLGQVALADPEPTVDGLRAAHERILVAGVEQAALIDALLALARGQAGVAQRSPVDLAELARAVAVTGPRMHLRLEPAPADGDPRLLARLVGNLVDNAVRHNRPGGSVWVRTGTDGGAAVLTVANDGPVLAVGEVGALFEPFRRRAPDRTGSADGLGLGLSIVRAVADAHGAAVRAVPRPGGGLELTVSLSRTGP